MRYFLILLSIFLISSDIASAQCGLRARQQAETMQRSTVSVPEGASNKEIKKLATVSKKEAKKIATSQYPGKVKKADLIIEEGTLVWKLEVKGNEGQKEVFVDPGNGSFLRYGLTK